MLQDVPVTARAALRPLFAGLPGLHGLVDAVLDGGMGDAVADDIGQSSIAHIKLDFDVFAGEFGDDSTATHTAEEAVRRLRPGASVLTTNSSWDTLIAGVWGDRVGSYQRVSFSPGSWSGDQLRALQAAPGDRFSPRRVASEDVARFAELADSLVYNFDSLEDFAMRGVGFGIEHDGTYVSGCSSFAISPHSLEFEIQTHPNYRNRGLAAATAAAMIEYCLANSLRPNWDAHNPTSARLAERIGFTNPAPYTAYQLAVER